MSLPRSSIASPNRNDHSASAAQRAPERRAQPIVGRFEIPIVDAQRRIVGWTRTCPNFHAGALRHPEAERTLGEPVLGVYVQILDPAAARRAGAPAGWRNEWRCLGLCSEQALTRSGGGHELLAVGCPQ